MHTTIPPPDRSALALRPPHPGATARPARRVTVSASTPTPSPDDAPREDPNAARLLATAALAVAAAAALAAAAPPPSHAWEHPHHGWKEGARPRRHTRHMGEWDRWAGAARKAAKAIRRRVRWADEEAVEPVGGPVSKVELAVDKALDSAEAGVRGARAALGSAARSAARALGVEVAGPGGTRVRVGGARGRGASSSTTSPSYMPGAEIPGLSLGADSPPSRLVAPPSYTARLAARTPLTDAEFSTAAWVAAGVGAVALLSAARKGRWLGGRGRRGGRNGRWVRDRSLGGKMVWVEEDGGGGAPFSRAPRFEDDDGGSVQPASSASASAYGSDFFDFEGADGSAKAAAAAAAAATRPPPPPSTSSSLPPWWEAPPKNPPLAFRDVAPRDSADADAVAIARAALSRLANSKAAGVDYRLADLIDLRLALAGTRVALAPASPSVRDAIFRAAAGEAAAAAAGGGGAAVLGGLAPAAFIAGLAADLAIPAAAAANMATAAVAALARSLLVDAAAAARDRSSGGPEPTLARLVCLVTALPFGPGAPQPPMVAAALAGKVRREELEALAATVAALEPAVAGAVAELLGLV